MSVKFTNFTFPLIHLCVHQRASPETAEEGGLLSYGPRVLLCYRHVVSLVDKVLRGTKPADLPIEQPSKFELVVNLKTASTLGMTISPALLLRADEVLE